MSFLYTKTQSNSQHLFVMQIFPQLLHNKRKQRLGIRGTNQNGKSESSKLNILDLFRIDEEKIMIQDNQNKDQKIEVQISAIDQHIDSSQQVQSQFQQIYWQYFQAKDIPIDDYLNKMNQEKVKYSTLQFHDEMTIRIAKHDQRFKIVFLNIKYGWFQTTISLLISTQKSKLHLQELKFIQTNLSKIFFWRNDKNYVVKCYSIKNKDQSKLIFAEVIKQYFLLRVASQLGVGIPCQNYFGFDIFIYDDCIEFFTQECQTQKHNSYMLDPEYLQLLKHKLRILHSLNIVHVDIKPDNMLFCRRKSQFLFCDFGFSKVIKQKVGLKTRTNYIGTFNYNSPQMRQIYKQGQGLVDLYFNDYYGLKVTIQELQFQRSSIQLTNQYNCQQRMQQVSQEALNDPIQDETQQITIFYSLIKLKYEIFMNNKKVLLLQENQQIILSNIHDILEFINERSLNGTSQKVYDLIIKKSRLPEKEIKVLLNMQNKKQRHIWQLQKQQNEDQNCFFAKFSIQQDKDSEYLLSYFNKIKIIINQNKWKILFDQVALKNYPKYKYYALFCQFVDFRASYSAFQQKKEVSKIFVKIQKLFVSSDNLTAQFKLLEVCLKFLLSSYKKTFMIFYEKMIPLIIMNLVFIKGLSHIELIEEIKQILKLDPKLKEFPRIFYKLFDVTFWLKSKLMFSLEEQVLCCQTVDKIYEQYRKYLQRQNNEDIINLIELLLFFQQKKRTIVQKQNTLREISNIIETLKDVDSDFLIELKLQEFYLCMYYSQVQEGEYSSFLQVVKQVNEIDPRILNDDKRVDKIHIRLLSFCENEGNNELRIQFYRRFYKCFGKLWVLKIYFSAMKNPIYKFETQELLQIKQQQSSYQILKLQQIITSLSMQDWQSEKEHAQFLASIKIVINKQVLKKMAIVNPKRNKIYLRQYYITFTYMMIHYYDSQFLNLVQQITSKLQDQLSKIEQLQNFDKAYRQLFCFKEILAWFSKDFSQWFQLYLQLIRKIIKDNAVSRNKSSALLVCISKLAQIILDQKYFQRKQYLKYMQTINEYIKSFKIYLVSLSVGFCQYIFQFLHMYNLYIKGNFEENINMHQQLLQILDLFPQKKYIYRYETYLQRIILQNRKLYEILIQRCWIEMFFIKKHPIIKQPLFCLYLSLIFNFFISYTPYFQKAKYYICKNIDSIAKYAKVITLRYFFNFYLLSKFQTIQNNRQRRFKTRKFITYADAQVTMRELFQKLILKKNVKKSNKRKMLSVKLWRFYKNHKGSKKQQ